LRARLRLDPPIQPLTAPLACPLAPLALWKGGEFAFEELRLTCWSS
jgi:hypothetical protein